MERTIADVAAAWQRLEEARQKEIREAFEALGKAHLDRINRQAKEALAALGRLGRVF